MNTDGNSEENAYFIDQNSQYYYQVIIEGGQTVLVRSKLLKSYFN